MIYVFHSNLGDIFFIIIFFTFKSYRKLKLISFLFMFIFSRLVIASHYYLVFFVDGHLLH